MIDVHLHGRLAGLLDRPGPLALDVLTPAEAVRAVCAVVPGALEVIRDGAWTLSAEGEDLSRDMLGLRFGTAGACHIRPAAAGAGLTALLYGVALLSAAFSVTTFLNMRNYDEGDAGRQSFLFRGAVNTTSQGGPVPLVYGGPIRVGSTVVSAGVVSDHLQKPPAGRVVGRWGYNTGRIRLEASRSTLRVVDLVGEGPMRGLVDGLKSVYIGGTPIENADGTRNIEGVGVEWRSGTADQEPLESIPDVETPDRFNQEVTNDGGPVVRTIVDADVDVARVTLRFPQLFEQKDNGRILDEPVEIRIETQASGGRWTTAYRQTVVGAIRSPAEVSWIVELQGDAPHNVRVTKLTDDDTDNEKTANTVLWVGLDRIVQVRQSYPHSALFGIVADAEKAPNATRKREYEIYGRLVDVPSNYDPETRIYQGVWDGTFKTAWTDNGAWAFHDVLQSRRFGLGEDLADEFVSAAKWDLYAIARFNDEPVPDGMGGTEPRYRFTGVIAKAAEAKKLLDSMLSNFRAALYYAEGAVTPVQDSPADPAALVGDANVVDGVFRYGEAVAHTDRVSAVAVAFTDPDDAYKLGVELVVDDELVAKYGHRRAEKAAMYCTSRAQAHRAGRHLLVEQEAEGGTLRYAASLDHASLRPGDIVHQVDSRRDGRRRMARTASPQPAGAVLQLDEVDLDAAPGRTWTAYVVSPEGDIQTREVAAWDPAAGTVTLDAAVEAEAGALAVFAADDRQPRLWRILSVAERDDLEFEVAAREHEPRRYALVEAGYNVSVPESLDLLGAPLEPPATVTAEENLVEEDGATRSHLLIGVGDPEGGRDPRVEAVEYEWLPPGFSDYRPLGERPGGTLDVPDAELGAHRARARYRAGGDRSAWTESAAAVVAGFERIAPPAGFAADAGPGGYTASWDEPAEADYDHTKVWDAPDDQALQDWYDANQTLGMPRLHAVPGVAVFRGVSRGSTFVRIDAEPGEELRVWARHYDRAGRAGGYHDAERVFEERAVYADVVPEEAGGGTDVVGVTESEYAANGLPAGDPDTLYVITRD